MNLIDLFGKTRFWGGNRRKFLDKIRLYSIANKLNEYLANIILPIYFKLTYNNPNYTLHKNRQEGGGKVIVSLTSFPARIPRLWLVIECILRQTVKPDRIILYLSKKQIKSLDTLPPLLLNQQKRGLEIILCDDDLRSHKKYYYAFRDYPNDIVITFDDDIFYQTNKIEQMLQAAKEHPGCIITNWAKEILPNVEKYSLWPDVYEPKESIYFLPIGVSCVLYPPNCMYKDVCDETIFKEHCFLADDVWLTCMSILKGTPKYYTNHPDYHTPVIIRNNVTLLTENTHKNQKQIENLNRYYKKKIGIEPFKRSV